MSGRMTGDKEGSGGLPKDLEEDRLLALVDELPSPDSPNSPIGVSESIARTKSWDSLELEYGIESDDDTWKRFKHKSSLEFIYSHSDSDSDQGFKEEAYRTYQPLGQGEIRILILLPGKNEETNQCATSRVVFDSKPVYEAISYTWNASSNNLIHISLNGENRLTPPNLVHCLYNLGYEDAPRALWIDSICINQTDEKEKSIQVALMAEIYGLSSRTMIWLGADEWVLTDIDSPGYHYGFDVPEEFRDGKTRYSDAFSLLQRLSTKEHLPYTTKGVLHVLSLAQVTKLSWWERMWVVQETLVSQDAYLMIGKATLSWKIAFQAISNYVAHTTTCCRFVKMLEPYQTYASIFQTAMQHPAQVILSFQRVPSGTRNELLANLWMFRNRMATLPHDKVYGVLGMIYTKKVVMTPDYGKPWATLCANVTLEDIRVSENLHALRGVRPEQGITLAPSWTIDWSHLSYWERDRARILTELYKKLYCATAMLPAQVSCDKVSQELSVAGSLVDQVLYTARAELFDVSASRGWRLATWSGLPSLLEKLKQHGDGSYISGGSAFSAFWRTLLADCIVPQREDEDVFYNQQVSENFVPSTRRVCASDLFAYLARRLNPEFHRWKFPAVIAIEVSIARATAGRCMFITSQGYIGLGPEVMREGDQVALLLGGTTPFVLRQRIVYPSTGGEKTRYSLLGDCYMHGCMDGELVEGQQTDEWPMLTLR